MSIPSPAFLHANVAFARIGDKLKKGPRSVWLSGQVWGFFYDMLQLCLSLINTQNLRQVYTKIKWKN